MKRKINWSEHEKGVPEHNKFLRTVHNLVLHTMHVFNILRFDEKSLNIFFRISIDAET